MSASPRIAPLQPPPTNSRSKHRTSTSGTSSPLSASPRVIATTAHSRSSSTAASDAPSFPSLAPTAEPDFLSGPAAPSAQPKASVEGAKAESSSKPAASGDRLDFLSLNAAPAQPRPASPVEIQGLEPVVRRKLNITVTPAGPSEDIDSDDDMSATPAPSTPVGTVSLRSKAKISAGRTRVDSPNAPARKSLTYKPLTINVASPAAPTEPSAPAMPPSPKSPKNNPIPGVERIRRTSTTFRDKVLINALPILLGGRPFAIHRNKVLGQQEISGPVINQETTREFIPIHVTEDLLHLTWDEPGIDPMHSKIALLEVDQVTRWLSAEEKTALGNATKAAFSVIFGAGSAQGERRVTFLAPDEEILNSWTAGLTELVSKLDVAKKAQALNSVVKDIPDLYVEVWLGDGPTDFRALIEAEVFNRVVAPAIKPPQRPNSFSGPSLPLQNELAGSPVGGRRKFSVTGGSEVRTSEYGQRFSVSNNSNERKGVLKRINVFPFLRRGMDFLKFGRRGTPHFRKFRLAKDNRTLVWTSKFKSAEESSVPLDAVDELRLGQATYVFERNDARPELEGASFSLVYEKRQKTLDLIAITSNAYNLWTAGIQKLIEFIQVSTPEDVGTMTELYAEVLISDSPTNYMPMIDRFH